MIMIRTERTEGIGTIRIGMIDTKGIGIGTIGIGMNHVDLEERKDNIRVG
jgi:hypothetical protein